MACIACGGSNASKLDEPRAASAQQDGGTIPGMTAGSSPPTGSSTSPAAPCPHAPIRFAIEPDPSAPICVGREYFTLGRPANYELLCEGDEVCGAELPVAPAPLEADGVSITWPGLVRIEQMLCTNAPGNCRFDVQVLCAVEDPAIGLSVAPVDRVVFWAYPQASGACDDSEPMQVGVPFDPATDTSVVVSASDFVQL